mmetsp:Transcript_13440/g.51262  ORF Transcript_13440/g.51262 Transcript_13440/m.51262 type:complete len:333 (-) Transcript_13440:474-1472(-)
MPNSPNGLPGAGATAGAGPPNGLPGSGAAAACGRRADSAGRGSGLAVAGAGVGASANACSGLATGTVGRPRLAPRGRRAAAASRCALSASSRILASSRSCSCWRARLCRCASRRASMASIPPAPGAVAALDATLAEVSPDLRERARLRVRAEDAPRERLVARAPLGRDLDRPGDAAAGAGAGADGVLACRAAIAGCWAACPAEREVRPESVCRCTGATGDATRDDPPPTEGEPSGRPAEVPGVLPPAASSLPPRTASSPRFRTSSATMFTRSRFSVTRASCASSPQRRRAALRADVFRSANRASSAGTAGALIRDGAAGGAAGAGAGALLPG